MKPLTCEMCGSTNILKQDGVFVCQSCGTKYSVEEAKKMMVEGVVNIEGKVKIDQSDKVPNLLSLAQNAIDSLNVDEAESYVKRILEIDCDNAQAWFIKMKAIGLSSSIDNLRVTEIISAGKKAIEKSNGELEIDVYGFYITVLNVNLQSFTEQLQNTGALKQIYELNCISNPFKASELTADSDEIFAFIMSQYELLLSLRYVIPDDKVAHEELSCLVGFAAKTGLISRKLLTLVLTYLNRILTKNPLRNFALYLIESSRVFQAEILTRLMRSIYQIHLPDRAMLQQRYMALTIVPKFGHYADSAITHSPKLGMGALSYAPTMLLVRPL